MTRDKEIQLPPYTDFSVYNNGGDYFIINPSKNFWFRLSREQIPAFELLDGKSTPDELRDRIDSSIPERLRDASKKLIEDIAMYYPVESRDIPKSNRVSTLYLVLTNACNSRCLYCFRERNNTISIIDKKLLKNVILSYKNIAVDTPSIVYTGGEPCLHPDLREIARFAHENGIKNTLQTNGLLVNEDNASLFARIFDKIQISFDSTQEELNDWLRGKKGHFKAVSHAVELFQRYDVKVKLAATITKKNFNDIFNIRKKFPGVDFQYTPMLQIGRGKKVSDLSFSPIEFLKVIDNFSCEMDAFYPKFIPEFGKKNTLCGAGTSVLSVDPDGDVFPCQMLHHPDFRCGNIKNDSLESIYYSSQTIEKFRKFSVDMLDECRECDIRYVCGGGCIANGFWENNCVIKKDYYCEFNKEITLRKMLNDFRKINLSGNN
ncbi:MAG TPA: radical SAM protein [Candidatus Wujingus californicus]|uniref:radical SAM protein n=1 Tax=Candidatus Wujingus californicus TaxID=3367618 RepID=UPI001DA45FF0|nr:radical SAM protein [Planctomycetota bacterium]